MIAPKARATRDILIHIGIVLCLSVSLFLGFFFVYLPASTHHGKSVTVPDLKGMSLSQLDEILSAHDLRFDISDSIYIPQAKPLTVLSQIPEPGAKVKEGRKVLVSITAFNPPEVEMPDLSNLSLRNADMLLQSAGLVRGSIRTEPAFSANVLRQEYHGQTITKKTKVPKGSVIALVLGDGIGPTMFETPNVVGKLREDAEILLRGSGLQVRTHLDYASKAPAGTVFKQEPESAMIRRGEKITIWVAAQKEPEPDSLSTD
ncbi:MAG: PASTA domain-containing protein [Bacteroidota bacterium]